MAKNRKLYMLRTVTSAVSIFFQGGIALTMGILFLVRYPAFLQVTPYFLAGTVSILCFFELLRIAANFRKGSRQTAKWMRCLIFGVCTLLLWQFPYAIWKVLPFALSLYALLLGLASCISFWQYRNDHTTAPLRYLLAAILQFSYTAAFWLDWIDWTDFSLISVGIYFILYGSSLLLDFLAEIFPKRWIKRLQQRVRVPLPTLLCVLMPLRTLKAINAYYAKTPDAPPIDDQKPGADEANLSIFIHIGRSGPNAIGHVDIVVDGVLYSYGGYDENSMKLFNGLGDGVMFTLEKLSTYIRMCTSLPGSILFSYDLVLSPEELQAVRQKLLEIRELTHVYKPAAQLYAEGRLPRGKYKDYCSRLFKHCDARFFKFRSGVFKRYWVLGTNCVLLADDILDAANIGYVSKRFGMAAPGAYFDYMEREFARPGSRVVRRRVYR